MAKLRSLPSKTTATPDNLPPVFLKKTSASLIKPIMFILTLSLKTSRIPNAWRNVLVRPLHKKGDRKRVKNYRPIALTSALCRVLERIIDHQLKQFYKSTSFFSDCQHGFRARRSTVTCLLSTFNKWKRKLLLNKTVHVLYLDFAKAFDVVNHKMLVHKLRSSLLKWLADFLSDRTLQVIVNDARSTVYPIPSGVLQGTVIGVTLFSVFIDDLPHSLPEDIGTDIFADDTKLFHESKDLLQIAAYGLE
jgi:hypothetical protein